MNRPTVATFGLLACLLLLVYWFGPTRSEKLVNELLDTDLCTNEFDEMIRPRLSLLTRGTRFEQHWQVNQRPKSGCVNVYVLHSDFESMAQNSSHAVRDLSGRFGFIGDPSLIVVDSEFLTSFIAPRRSTPFMQQAPEEELMTALLTWILGHEIGHVVSEHQADQGGQSYLDERVEQHGFSQQQETEADEFCARQIVNDPAAQVAVSTFLYDLLNSEIYLKVGATPIGVGIHFDYNEQKIVEYFTDQTHPEYVQRAANMLLLIGKLTDNGGMQIEAQRFLDHMRAASNPSRKQSETFDLRIVASSLGVLVSDAAVLLFEPESNLPRTATTDFKGEVLFQDLPRARPVAIAVCEDERGLACTEGIRCPPAVHREHVVTLPLQVPATLEATIADQLGSPVSELECKLILVVEPDPYDESKSIHFEIARFQTDGDGRFSHSEMIPNTQYRLRCADGRALETVVPAIVLQAGQTRRWDFTLH